MRLPDPATAKITRFSQATGFWDFLLSPSPFAARAFRSAFCYDGAIIEEGYPRNDLFHGDDADRRTTLVRKRLRLQNDRKIVLYAPTFRDGQTRGAATDYRDTLRGFYLDFEQEALGPIVKTTEEVVAALTGIDVVAQDYGDKVSAFATTYAPLDDSHASDRVLDTLFPSSRRSH